jgi:hypothetical protein
MLTSFFYMYLEAFVQYLSSCTEIISFHQYLLPTSACVKLGILLQFLVSSVGTFCLTLRNQTATSYLNVKKVFLLTRKFSYLLMKSPPVTATFFKDIFLFSVVSDATFTYFKLSHKIFSFSHIINYCSHFVLFISSIRI